MQIQEEEEQSCQEEEVGWLDSLVSWAPVGTNGPPPTDTPEAPNGVDAPAVDPEEQARQQAEERARLAEERDRLEEEQNQQLAQDIFAELDDAMGVGVFDLTDADAAQQLLAGRSASEMAAIRAHYLQQTGRSLESDVTGQFGGGAENEMMANVLSGMDLRDQIEHYETSGSMENLLESATPEQLEELVGDPTALATLRDKMDPQALMEARSRLFPDQRVDAVRERIEAANGVFDDDEGAVMAAFQTLSIKERQQFLQDHPDSLDFLNGTEFSRIKRMAESEASALRERMIQATEGLGTDDEALGGLAADAGRLVGEQRRIQEQLESSELLDDDRAALQARLAEMGDLSELMTPQRNADGSLVSDSFFGNLEGDVGDDRLRGLMGQMGVDKGEIAKQEVLAAIGLINDDERGIQEAFASLPADQRDALWADPHVQEALGHLNIEEQAVVASFRRNDVASMAATRIDDANGWASQDEAAILSSVMDMNAEDREAFRQTAGYRESFSRMNPQERLALGEAMDTGSISMETSMDAATIGLGTNDGLIALASERKSSQDTLAIRRGYVLAQEGIEPSTDEERAALARYNQVSTQMRGDMDGDEYQQAMDALLAHNSTQTDAYTGQDIEAPSSAAIERSTADGRMNASLLMDARADELMGPDGEGGGGLAAWFSDTDETAVQAHQSQKGAHYEALFDGEVGEAELSGHEALSQAFAEDYDAMVAAQSAITDAVATGLSVVAAIALTLATSGAAGPVVAAFMAKYGVAVTAATTLVTSVGTKELMGGDRYDSLGEAGATDVAMSMVDAATGHLAGKAGESVRRTVSGVIPSVVSEGTQGVTGALLREGAGGVLRNEAAGIAIESTVDALASGAMGSVVRDLTSEEFYQGDFGESMLDMGSGVVESVPGSLQSAAISSTMKGASTVWSTTRLNGFMNNLESNGMPAADLEALDMRTLDRLSHAQLMIDAGNPERAAQVIEGLDLTPEQRRAIGSALYESSSPAPDVAVPNVDRSPGAELTPEIQASLDPERNNTAPGVDSDPYSDPWMSEEVRLELAQQQVQAAIDGGLEGPMADYLIQNLDSLESLESVLQVHDLGLSETATSFIPALVESGVDLTALEPGNIEMIGEAYQAIANGELGDAMAALELAGLDPAQRSELLQQLSMPRDGPSTDDLPDRLFSGELDENGMLIEDPALGFSEFDEFQLDETQEYTSP